MVPIPPLLQNGMGGKRTFELWSSCPSIQLFHMLLPRTASCLSMKYLDDKSWSLDFFFFFKGRKKHNRKTPETLLDEDKMLPLALEEVSTEGALQLCAEQPASSLPLHLLGPGYFRSEQFINTNFLVKHSSHINSITYRHTLCEIWIAYRWNNENKLTLTE